MLLGASTYGESSLGQPPRDEDNDEGNNWGVIGLSYVLCTINDWLDVSGSGLNCSKHKSMTSRLTELVNTPDLYLYRRGFQGLLPLDFLPAGPMEEYQIATLPSAYRIKI